jgi:glycosyltransferase involved in cell wall biosynthesis
MVNPMVPYHHPVPGAGRSRRPSLSVCVCLKNRARVEHDGRVLSLFPNCVRALAEAASAVPEVGPVELVVADFHSDDWPLSEWLTAAAGALSVRVVPVDGAFSRGRGINRAIAEAASDQLLLFDADMLIQPGALRRAIEVVAQGQVWLPICRYLDEQGGLEFWNEYGYGIAAIRRATFDAAGGIPEFESWGGEDQLFFGRLALHAALVRERSEGLAHQWHPLGVRFVHYRLPLRSDLREHLANAAGLSRWGPPVRKFLVEHPDWRGELHLFENGRVSRPGLDGGDFVFEERRRLVLQWDRWPAVTLHWDERDHAYRDRTMQFTVRDIPLEPPAGAPGA